VLALLLLSLNAGNSQASSTDVTVHVRLRYCSAVSTPWRATKSTSVDVLLTPSYPRTPPIHYDLSPTFLSKDELGLSFKVTPGDYQVYVPWKSTSGPFLGADFLLTVLPGQPRSVGASICTTTRHYDSFRSVAGTLSFPIAFALILNDHSNTIVTIDGQAYYANGLPPGRLTLRAYLGGESRYCDFDIPKPSDGVWLYEHIRLDLSLAEFAKAESNGGCRL